MKVDAQIIQAFAYPRPLLSWQRKRLMGGGTQLNWYHATVLKSRLFGVESDDLEFQPKTVYIKETLDCFVTLVGSLTITIFTSSREKGFSPTMLSHPKGCLSLGVFPYLERTWEFFKKNYWEGKTWSLRQCRSRWQSVCVLRGSLSQITIKGYFDGLLYCKAKTSWTLMVII